MDPKEEGQSGAVAVSAPPEPVLSTVEVDFHKDEERLPQPLAAIQRPGADGRAPRGGSRRIIFTDDGKLFEGHLTVQSRSLKAVLQCLVARQEEQAVVMQDLQDQVHTLRTRLSRGPRFGKGAAMAGGGVGGGAGNSEVERRLKALESFVTLWGVRPADVEELVQNYGDPVLTPDAYTKYLVELPSFQLTRRDALMRPSISAEEMEAQHDTASRRKGGSFLLAQQQQQQQQHQAQAAGSGEALALANEALRQVEELRAAAAEPRETVDRQARADLEELAEYLSQRIEEVARDAAAPPPLALPPARDRSEERPPLREGQELVDRTAREDAATALDLIEELGESVDRRLRELTTSMSLRQPTGEQRPAAEPEPKPTKRREGGGGGAPARPAEAVDKVAREETRYLGERMVDMEDELTRRWQSIEERLRIIGRASMSPSAAASAGVAIDRKAREDASMSLMRIQALERELAAVRKLAASNTGGGTTIVNNTYVSSAPGSPSAAASGAGAGSLPPVVQEPIPLGLKDTYTAKVQDLEQEVEQRMAEVNRAIAMLRQSNTGGGGGGGGVSSAQLEGLLQGQSEMMKHMNASLAKAAEGPATGSSNGGGAVPPRPPLPQAGGDHTLVIRSQEGQEQGQGAGTGLTTADLAAAGPGGGAVGVEAPAKATREAAVPDYMFLLPSITDDYYNPRRSLASKLRSPTANTFGSRLVEPTDGLAPPQQQQQGKHAEAPASASSPPSPAQSHSQPASPPAATAAAPQGVRDAAEPRVAPPPKDAQSRPKQQQQQQRLRASIAQLPASARSASQQQATASLGHTKPCVVLNCAWCAAEEAQEQTVH